MKMTKTIKLGKNRTTFQFEGNTLWDAVMKSKYIAFDNIPKCGKCGSDDLYLDAHEAQEYKYTTIKCKNCRASLTLGERKDHTAVYPRKNPQGYYDWQDFKPKEATQSPNSPNPMHGSKTPPNAPPYSLGSCCAKASLSLIIFSLSFLSIVGP